MIQTKVDTRSTTCLLVQYVCMAIIGRSIVYLALYRNRRLLTVTNLYVLAFAMGDIFIATVVFPFSVMVLRDWPFNDYFAQFYDYITYVWGGVSIYTTLWY